MVSNLLRLLELPEAVKVMIEQRELGMGHARALLAIDSADELVTLARRVVRDGWSVRDTEKAVRNRPKNERGPPKKKPGGAADPDIRRFETDLADRLGARVKIEHSGPGGRLVIRYHSLDELDGIISHIE